MDWKQKYEFIFEGNRKNDVNYWIKSYYYNNPDATGWEPIMDEYVGHHYDFFWLSQVAQAARRGDIPHEWATEAIIRLIGVDEDPGDTAVPEDWEIGDPGNWEA